MIVLVALLSGLVFAPAALLSGPGFGLLVMLPALLFVLGGAA
ncbi:hypothetical protein [Nannocystis pusilla]